MPNPSVKKVCRVCGKEYFACRSSKRGTTTFRWQDVACSQECGTKYLLKIKSARSPISETQNTVEDDFNIIDENDDFDNEEYDELDAFFGNSEDIEE